MHFAVYSREGDYICSLNGTHYDHDKTVVTVLNNKTLVSVVNSVEEAFKRPDGSVEYLIACGASLGWNICYDKANDICPSGYTTLSENAGFNRKELRISCPSAKKSAQ